MLLQETRRDNLGVVLSRMRKCYAGIAFNAFFVVFAVSWGIPAGEWSILAASISLVGGLVNASLFFGLYVSAHEK